jgi:hypothetical protein
MQLKQEMSKFCDRAHAQMKKVARSANNIGKCREVNMTFGLHTRNDTRWVSEYKMMKSALKAHPFLEETDIFLDEEEQVIVAKDKKGEVLRREKAMLFRGQELRKAKEFLTQLEEMAKYCKEIQAEDTDLLRANNIFTRAREDKIIKGSKNEWQERLSEKHKLCKEKDFERACTKIIAGQQFEKRLTTQERKAAECLLKSSFKQAYPDHTTDDDVNLDEMLRQNPEELQRSQKKRDVPLGESDYVNVKQVYPITAGMERVFSKAKMMMPAHRKKMQPVLMEALMMLLVNEAWWDLQFFTEVFQHVWDNDMIKNGCDLDIHKRLDDDDPIIDMDILDVEDGEADYDAVMAEAHGDDPEAVEREVMEEFIGGLDD